MQLASHVYQMVYYKKLLDIYEPLNRYCLLMFRCKRCSNSFALKPNNKSNKKEGKGLKEPNLHLCCHIYHLILPSVEVMAAFNDQPTILRYITPITSSK